LNSSLIYSHVFPFLVSMLPVSELRGGLPLALSQGVAPLEAYLLSILGNTIPVLPLLLGLKSLVKLAKRYKWSAGIFQAIQKKTWKKQKLVQKYGVGGIIILVAIPLPMTGAWTGSLVSVFLSIPIKYAFPAIFGGICLAGFIVLFATTGFWEIGRIFGGM